MSDRLDELRRQRELVRQHLDWLDRQIAGSVESAAPPQPPTAHPARTAIDAGAFLTEHQAETQSSSTRVKLGCWTAFVGAFAALVVLIGAWYLLRSS